jgi:hypothetical protein
MVGLFAFILKVKGSNFMSGVVCDQQWQVDWIFSYLLKPKFNIIFFHIYSYIKGNYRKVNLKPY